MTEDEERSGGPWRLVLGLVAIAGAALAALLLLGERGGDSHRELDRSPLGGSERGKRDPLPGILGRVLGPQGRPLGGLQVDFSVVRSLVYLPQSLERAGRQLEARVGTTTDEDGRFHIHPLPRNSPTGVLSIEPPGLAPHYENLSAVDALEHRDLGEIHIGNGAELHGRILGAEGEPPGEDLRATLVHSLELGPELRAPLRAVQQFRPLAVAIATDGEFRMQHLPPGRCLLVVEGTRNLAARGSEFLTLSEGEVTRIEVRMYPGRQVEGEVRDTAGQPLEGARVVIAPLDAEGSLSLARELATAADGRFHTALAPSDHALRIAVSLPGFQDTDRVLRASERRQIFMLRPRVTIAGRVLDRENRTPIDGVWLGSFPADEIGEERIENPYWAARSLLPHTSDAEGRFRISGHGPGRYRVVAKHSAYLVTRSVEVRVGTRANPSELEFLLERGLELELEVRGPGGRPLAEAGVSLRSEPVPGDDATIRGRFRFPPEGREIASALTPPDGRVAFRLLRPGSYRIYLRHRDYPRIPFTGITLEPDRARTEQIVQVQHPATLTGTLLVGGQPSAAWKIFAIHEGGSVFEASPDTEGAFAMAAIPPGIYQVVPVPRSRHVAEACWAIARGTRLEHPAERELRIHPAAGAALEFDLDPVPLARVSGALNLAGRSYLVWFMPAKAPPGTPLYNAPSATTDAAGRFQIDDLPFGSYRLVVTASAAAEGAGGQPQKGVSFAGADPSRAILYREVTIADPEVDLGYLAAATGIVEGRVVDAEGAPIGPAQLTVRRKGHSTFTLPIDAAGNFNLGEIATGALELEVIPRRDSQLARRTFQVSISAGRNTPLELRFSP